MDLTDKQRNLWELLGSDLSANEAVREASRQYYLQYRNSFDKESSYFNGDERILNILRIAYFLSQKTQLLFNLNGDRVNTIALSVNAIIRNHLRYEDFVFHLKEMIRIISLPAHSQQVQEEINIFIKRFSFMMTFFNKLTSTFKKIRINQKQEVRQLTQEAYCQFQISFIWLLFIDCRCQAGLDMEIVENTCLLNCIFSYFLMQKYREDGIYSIYFDDVVGGTLGNDELQIEQFMQEYFRIKDTKTYLHIKSAFSAYLKLLSQKIDDQKPFSAKKVRQNYQRIDKQYGRKLNQLMLDERNFLKDRNSLSNQRVRVTPFGRRDNFKIRNNQNLSHCILNYEFDEEQTKQQKRCEGKLEEMNFLKRLREQPTPKAVLIKATPMSEAMQMYNWAYQKSKNIKIKNEHFPYLLKLIKMCKKQNENQHSSNNKSNQNIQLIYGLWQECGKFIQNKSPKYQESLLLISIETIFHIVNAPQNDLGQIATDLQISWYEMWIAVDLMLNYDKKMPLPIKMHLLNLETSIVNSKIWKEASTINSLIRQYDTQQEGPQHRLYRRVVHHIAFQIHLISARLGICEHQNQIMMTMRYILLNQQNLLHNRTVDQLVICSIYAICRVNSLEMRFNDILMTCREVNGFAVKYYEELVQKVLVGDRVDNIIVFYNSIFVQTLKSYLKNIKEHQQDQIYTKHSCFLPSITDMLARDISTISSPQMASYYAYNESPIFNPRLKRGPMRQISNTVKKQGRQYNLQDIQNKFGKFHNSTLKQARKSRPI